MGFISMESAVSMPENYSVVLADDHAFIRKGLISILDQYRTFRVMAEAGDGLELLRLLEDGIVPDVLVLDLSMPLLSGIEAMRLIRKTGFDFKILVLTMHKESDYLCQALLAGANGYMLKDGVGRELLPALHTLLRDRLYLSPLMAEGLPDRCRMKAVAEQDVLPSSAVHCDNRILEPPQ
jgi:DNA-binding NarL/FixJ family response regulator